MTYKKLQIYYWGLIAILLSFSCSTEKAPPSTTHPLHQICILEQKQDSYELEQFVQILEDSSSSFTIQDIKRSDIQARFQNAKNHSYLLKSNQAYWAKFSIENQLPEAQKYMEWVLNFSAAWTEMDIYIEQEDGTIEHHRNGFFVPNQYKNFVPTSAGNLTKIQLPPQQQINIYYRAICHRSSILPNFQTTLQYVDDYYADLLYHNITNSMFLGFVLMMLLYNLIFYFFGRNRSFIYYSIYLLMLVLFSAYMSGDLEDWLEPTLFSDHPEYILYGKIVIYIFIMSYLAFVSSFLELRHLLPFWNRIFNIIIVLGFFLMIVDMTLLSIFDFTYVTDDVANMPYTFLYITITFCLIYPLYKTKDKKGYFIIAGILASNMGILLALLSRVNIISFAVFYFKIGMVLEITAFSLGLAYRQRQIKQAKQQADFELKKSQLLQEKKQMEANRLQELNDFKSRFYTNITHEFRTPLTVIMGMTEHIAKHEKEKKLILRNSENLLRLINQLLDLSKLESGKLKLNKVNRDIIAYLKHLTESFYTAAATKQIQLLFYTEVEVLKMDYDEEKIQQIVYNLLSNAIKFTPNAGKIIFHSLQIEQNGRPFLKLKVKDSGIGISSDKLEHIFDRFFQIDNTSIRKGEGTGIGLALIKELVELMNGHIEVNSTVQKGTEFIIYLPIKSKIKESNISYPEFKTSKLFKKKIINEEKNTPPKNNKTLKNIPQLLIIEDNEDVIVYIKTLLQKDYEIHTAQNGQKGIDIALETIPDIIISDVMMPEKDGFEVCDTLKKDERTSHIPIILLTAKTAQKDKIQGLKHGADAYLTKPFQKEELIIRLEKLIEIRQKLQQKYATIEAIPSSSISIPSEPNLDDIFLQKLKNVIQTHLSNADFEIPMLAKEMSMSQMQVYRKLKALTGKTPSKFIRSIRLQKAKELLLHSDLNISEIAFEVGFADPNYFSRVFQKEFGRSPSDFSK